MAHDKALVLSEAFALISEGQRQAAAAFIKASYPFEPPAISARRYGLRESTRVFLRDAFIDRYSGTRLVFPGALRLLSVFIPEVFPYHSNWRMVATHPAYWEAAPTIDHVVPIARGGADTDANRLTTSMLRNAAKANWTLAELGWQLHPAGSLNDWDGMIRWFLDESRRFGIERLPKGIQHWYAAATASLAEVQLL